MINNTPSDPLDTMLADLPLAPIADDGFVATTMVALPKKRRGLPLLGMLSVAIVGSAWQLQDCALLQALGHELADGHYGIASISVVGLIWLTSACCCLGVSSD